VTGCRTLGDLASRRAAPIVLHQFDACDLTLVTGIALRHTDNIGLAASDRVGQMTAGPIEIVQMEAADAAPHGGRVK
jgi:hypothetical protein